MKNCPFCSAPLKEQCHKCLKCQKTLMKDLDTDLSLRPRGYAMRPYPGHQRHRHRMWMPLIAGIVLALLIAVGGGLELLSASWANQAAGSVLQDH